MDDFQTQIDKMRASLSDHLLPQVADSYKGNWIVDVGSNVGTFIDSALQLFPDATILAFEPVSMYYQYTIDRFKNLDNVYIENLALSDKNGTADIFVASENIGWNTMVEEMVDGDNAHNLETIKTTSFDLYLDYAGLVDVVVDIIKIDTEGYEYKVIRGMRRFLERQKPAILCEIGWGKQHPFWNEELVTFDYLFGLGYKVKNNIDIESLEGTQDVVFIYEG